MTKTHIPDSIETERLILRPWQARDLALFAAMSADPEVMRYFADTLDVAQSEQLAHKAQHYIQQNGWGFWAIELKATQQFIGMAGLHPQPELFHFSPAVEIGWRLDRAYWHQGYAFEAASASLDYAFEHLKLDQVYAFTATQNHPSETLMQRLGMHYVEQFQHPELDPEHPLCLHVLYCMTQQQYHVQGEQKTAL